MAEPVQDQWAQWLLHRRHGDDPQQAKAVLDALIPVRDRVLRNARVSNGETLLDVGTGDGLIAFGALTQVGESGRVIFSDISQDLLDHCRALAAQMNLLDRCQFLNAPADDFTALANGSVDAVTTRSVLIYVGAKQRAFDEFYRVLKPGGRLSIFEPINRFRYPPPPNVFGGYDVTPVASLAQKLWAVYARLQPLESDPMLDFDERDLLDFAEKTGFHEIHLEYQANIAPARQKINWETLLRMSGNPRIPTIGEAMQQALTPDEIEELTAYLRPLVETRPATTTSATAYLWAIKA